MKGVKTMYLDESIELGELPGALKYIMTCVDELYHEGDESFFYARLDEVEAIAKQACSEGQITEEQLDAVFRRYGLR